MSAGLTPDPEYSDWADLSSELAEQVDPAILTAAEDDLRTWLRAYRLAEARKRRNLTQAQVAKAMGITQGRISQIERGEVREAEVETLTRYAAALGGTLRLVVDFGDDLMQIA
jgi:predicted XRE-type DNA-binding protein